MSQIGDVFRNEGQKMPPSEIETSKIQLQIDEIIPLQEKKKKCVLRGDTAFANVLLTRMFHCLQLVDLGSFPRN